VNTKNGVKSISELVVGDEVESNDNKWNRVQTIFPQKKKKAYRITTKSGDQITCSAEHLFPTENGEKSIKDGLIVGEKIFIK
jgi:intein/homing endonuclease